MRQVKTIGLVFVLLLIGCTTAQYDGNSYEMPAPQPDTTRPETTDSHSEASTPSYQTEETVRAENTFTKSTLRDHHQQVNDLLAGAPFSFSVGSGNANNRVELTVPTEQAWQQFIADANFELPSSVVVLFAYEAGFDAPPAHLNTPLDIYLARRQFPPTVVEGVGFGYMRVVVEDGCVLLRNEWTEQLDTLIVPPHLFLHADSDSDALVFTVE